MFYIGVDLGQKLDYTAIAIVEREDARGYAGQPVPPMRLLLRRVHRVPLGTPYPRVVELIRDVTCERVLAGQCALVVDGTGVGAPVVDMLRAAGLRCELTAVTITGGDRETRRGSRDVGVPKRDLIAGVQLALEKGELRIARRMKELEALVRELAAMKIGGEGGDGGEHDDLVIALALACWRARRRQNGYGEQRLPCY
jgi:Terminase RNaseH-like domain